MMNQIVNRKQKTWSPFSDFRYDMDRFFDDFWEPRNIPTQSEHSAEWFPHCDVVESEGHYLLTIDLPGIPKDQIKIEALDGKLTISGERKQEEKKTESGAWYTERRYGKFQRSFSLPVGIDTNKIEANYEDGVLKLYVPKAEAEKPKQIKIGTTNSSSGFFGRLIGQKDDNAA